MSTVITTIFPEGQLLHNYQSIREDVVVRTTLCLHDRRLPVAVRSQVVAFIGEYFEVISVGLSYVSSIGSNQID